MSVSRPEKAAKYSSSPSPITHNIKSHNIWDAFPHTPSSTTDTAPPLHPSDFDVVTPQREEYLAKLFQEKRRRARHAAREQVRPALWARMACGDSKKTAFLIALIAVMLGAIGLLVGRGGLRGGLKGLETFWGSEELWLIARDDWEIAWRRAREQVIRLKGGEVPTGAIEYPDGGFNIIFESVDENTGKRTNVLTRENLAQIRKIEMDIMEHPAFREICFRDTAFRPLGGERPRCTPPISITTHPNLYGIWVEDDEGDKQLRGMKNEAEPVSESDFRQFLNNDLSEYPWVAPHLSKEFDGSSSPFVTTRVLVGLPLSIPKPGLKFLNQFDRPNTQRRYLKQKMKSLSAYLLEMKKVGNIVVHASGKLLQDQSFWFSVRMDLVWCCLFLSSLFVLVWLRTESLLLAVSGVLQVVLSVPAAFCFYRLVFQIPILSGFHLIPILGLAYVAVTDVFVFTDTWNQAAVILGEDCDTILRMSWVYQRAGKASALTNLPIAAVFFASAFVTSPGPSSFAIWSGILICTHQLIFISMFPCFVSIWHSFWRRRRWSRCLGYDKFGDDLALTTYGDPDVQKHRRCFALRMLGRQPEEDYAVTELFFRNHWTRFVNETRYLTLLIALGLLGGAIFLLTRLEPDMRSVKLLRTRNELQTASNIAQASFTPEATGTQLKFNIVHGLRGLDRDGFWRYNLRLKGNPIYEDSLDLRKSEAIDELARICKEIGDDDDLQVDVTKTKCWPELFRDWEKHAYDQAVGTDYETHKEFIRDLEEFSKADIGGVRPDNWIFTGGYVGQLKAPQPVLSNLEFYIKMSKNAPLPELESVYRKWKKKLDSLNRRSVRGIPRGRLSTNGAWEVANGRKKLYSKAIIVLGVALGVVFLSFLFTSLNIVVTIFSFVTAGSVIISSLGVLRLIGNGLIGMTGLTTITLVSGIAIKDIALITRGYLESKTKANRFLRVRDSFLHYGVSIFAKTVAILIAAAFLLGTQVRPVFEFVGILLCMTALSALYALVFFPALLLFAGPEGNTGSVRSFFKSLFKHPLQRWRKGKSQKWKDSSGTRGYHPFVFDESLEKVSRSAASSLMMHSSDTSSCYQPFVFDDTYGCHDVASMRHLFSRPLE